jgi:hypothetical protein
LASSTEILAATPSASGHAAVGLNSGYVGNNSDIDTWLVALQVL